MPGPSNFKNGVASYGIPIIPSTTFGPTSKTFFVDGATGSNNNAGTSPRKPLATITKALSLCTDKAGDTIFVLNDGNTSGTSRDAATISWTLDNTHLIGVCAPTMISQRSRVSPPTSATAIVTPQITVSGHGNTFANLSFFEGTSEDSVASECIRVTGNRNYFYNVAMMNLGDASNGHSGDEANSAHLKISGGEENTFERCYIGLDTAARSAGNANVELVSAAARNIFKNCFFPMFADAATPVFVKVDGSGDIDRFVLFEDCQFYNAIGSTGTTINQGFSIHASAGGLVLLRNCSMVGATELETTASTNLYVNMPTPDGAQASGAAMVAFTT